MPECKRIPNNPQASCRILVRRVPDPQVGNTHRTTARGETTDCARVPHRASGSPLLYRSRCMAWCPEGRRCPPAIRSRQWSAQRPYASIIRYQAGVVKFSISRCCRMFCKRWGRGILASDDSGIEKNPVPPAIPESPFSVIPHEISICLLPPFLIP